MISTTRKHPKTIIVSAVNLNVGGTLTILRECLSYLSELAADEEYKVIAIVYKRELADYPNIIYVETDWPKKRWINRLWFEYVSARKISKKYSPVHLWLSLHDTSPNVVAEKRAVYCHNPFPFYNWKWIEWFLTPKIVLFALFSKLIYKTNITKNNYVIVQQDWIRNEFLKMFDLQKAKIIVALPNLPTVVQTEDLSIKEASYHFIYPASANSHKNFECLAEATRILNNKGVTDFKVSITLNGDENAYSKWLNKKWGHVPNLIFAGFLNRTDLFTLYAKSHCLVFPSKVETWGLPITEFGAFGKPMLLADLPFAHETAAGFSQVGFFDPNNPLELASEMEYLLNGNRSFLHGVKEKNISEPVVRTWQELFKTLLHQ